MITFLGSLGGTMQHQSSEEIIARFIAQAFPAANLKIQGEGDQVVYEILLNEKMLVRLDRICAIFNFPTRGSGKMSWSGIKEGSPEAVAANIIQNLANAGFTVLSPEGKRIQKRPVFIGRHTFCPQCNEHSLVRRIVYGMISQELDSEKFISGGHGTGFEDPEIRCVGCGWEGIPEDVRFTKKIQG
jgi:hypothetical protein